MTDYQMRWQNLIEVYTGSYHLKMFVQLLITASLNLFIKDGIFYLLIYHQ